MPDIGAPLANQPPGTPDLDQGDWTDSAVFESYGVRLGVRVDSPALLAQLPPYLPPGTTRVSGVEADFFYSVRGFDARPERRFSVSAGSELRADAVNEETALAVFEAAVRYDVATSTANRLVFVHAGVVGWRNGAVVIPAPSGHGKSTLVAALVRAGATYYSDEHAILDDKGFVHPYARPLTLRAADGRALRVEPRELRAQTSLGALRIRWVVDTRHVPGVRWRPAIGTAADAVLVLLCNCVGTRLAPAHTLRTLRVASDQARLLTGPRGESAETAEALLRFLDERALADGECHPRDSCLQPRASQSCGTTETSLL